MKYAHSRECNVEGGSLENPTGGHKNTPHMSQNKDAEGQDEGGKVSQREKRNTLYRNKTEK